jgi:endonuclease I
MPSVNAPNFTGLPEYSDYHNLFPVNQNKVNLYRLNYPLGIVDSVTYQYLACKKGLDSLGHVVFEPKDDIKGDVARAMLYQILCYDGVDGRDWYLPVLIDSTSTMK